MDADRAIRPAASGDPPMTDRGACESFIAETEQLFAATLVRFRFERVTFVKGAGAADCQAMYESPLGRLLFFLCDGCANVCLGTRRAAFHAARPFVQPGEGGWYHLVALAEIAAGGPLLTPQLQQRILEGRLSYYQWQATLLAERAEALFSLLDPASESAIPTGHPRDERPGARRLD